MKFFRAIVFILALFSLLSVNVLNAKEVPLSEDTEVCIDCHSSATPGIVADWKKSKHAYMTVAEALKKSKLSREVSIALLKNFPKKLRNVAIGCAECHTMNPKTHRDTFEHNDFKVHVVVSPKDCAVCHAIEAKQYSKNIMSEAYPNLNKNPVYHGLMNDVNGITEFDGKNLKLKNPGAESNADSCNSCHGTIVKITGKIKKETDMGDMTFPVLSGWPNDGVGRINPDGSKGSCSACHTRHVFSIAEARKPASCSTCHKGPDVPAYKVYSVSKHGVRYKTSGYKWNFNHVPWEVGKDFNAPTCATCHISLLTVDGEVVVKRTHQMNDRSAYRLFGLIYAHPHPKNPNTTNIKNKAGLPLPTELTGEPVSKYLISKSEMDKRNKEMKKVCLSCHSSNWVDNHFKRLELSIKTTNKMTLTATKQLLKAWKLKLAKGLPDSVFNEAIERKWVEEWLFFANSTRYATAMCGADYGAFANGRWYLSKNIKEMKDWIQFLKK